MVAPLKNGLTESAQLLPATTDSQRSLLPHSVASPGVQFDSADGDDWLLVSSELNPLSRANDFAVSVVFSTSSAELTGAQGDWFENSSILDAASSGFGNGWGISINSEGTIAAGLGGGFGSPASTVTAGAGLNDGQTHIAIFSRSGNTISLQIDDGDPVSIPANDKPVDPLELAIGAQKLGNNSFDGFIAEFRTYSDSLTVAETDALYSEFVSTYDNQAPVAVPDFYSLPEDTTFFAVPIGDGLLANDTDNEGDALTAILVDATQNGRVTVSEDGTLLYIPDPDFFGTDTFTYSASDFRPSAPAIVTFNVTPVYDAATPAADQFKTTPTSSLTIDAANGVLSNDSNPDRADLRALLDQDVDNGALTLNDDGSFSYDPQGFAGMATFRYKIDDGTQVSCGSDRRDCFQYGPSCRQRSL